MSAQWQRKRITSRLTLRENANSSPMVNAATEQGITVVVIIGQLHAARPTKGTGYRKGIA